MERQKKYNKLILETLSKLIEKYPDLRFGQILVNADIITYKNDYDEMVPRDPYYEEPEVTLERMKNNKFAFKELFN
jgi:hypothetical protein